MTRRLLAIAFLSTLTVMGIRVAAPAQAMPLDRVVATIADSGGRYQPGGASLTGSDCSGLVSVAQSLAMGQKPHRLGSTRTLLAGKWPDAIRGATPGDKFIIGSSSGHMVAEVSGVRLESRSSGEPYRIGPQARDPFSMPTVWHIDERVLVA